MWNTQNTDIDCRLSSAGFKTVTLTADEKRFAYECLAQEIFSPQLSEIPPVQADPDSFPVQLLLCMSKGTKKCLKKYSTSGFFYLNNKQSMEKSPLSLSLAF